MKQYGAPILFSENSNTEQYVFSSQISVYEALNTANNCKCLTNDQKLIFVYENENIIFKKADQIVSLEIDSAEGININSLDPSDISIDTAKSIVLRELWKFRDCNMKPLSIPQDKIYIKSKGRKKMPKHRGIAVSLKGSVSSKEFIIYLNNSVIVYRRMMF